MVIKFIKLALSNWRVTLRLFSLRRLQNVLRVLLNDPGNLLQIFRRYRDIYAAAGPGLPLPHLADPGQPILITFPLIDWHFRQQRPQHLALQLGNRGWPVFYMAPTTLQGDAPYRLTEQVGDSVWLCQFQAGSQAGGSVDMHHGSLTDAAQAKLIESIAAFKAALGATEIIAIVQHPYWGALAGQVADRMLYDCMDHHAGFADGASQDWVAGERALIAAADMVTVSSVYLHDRIAAIRPATVIRNGCDYALFAKVKTSSLNVRPVIGYVGAISAWFDLPLVIAAAQAHPGWDFRLAGATAGCDTAAARQLPNIAFLGEIDYADVPTLVAGFDVCLIPFRLTELIKATNPVKVYEYLAAGKPVVATAMPEVLLLSDLVHIATTPANFIDKIEQALNEGDDALLRQRRQAFATQQDWQQRGADLAKLLI